MIPQLHTSLDDATIINTMSQHTIENGLILNVILVHYCYIIHNFKFGAEYDRKLYDTCNPDVDLNMQPAEHKLKALANPPTCA